MVGGDYNNVELVEDHNQGYFGSTMGGREVNVWNSFLMSLGLQDAWNLEDFRRIRNENFTWSKKSLSPIWSHLDRFYVDAHIQKYGRRNGIWPTMANISDHVPIFVEASLKSHKCGGQLGLNLQLLQREKTKY
jgi:hypothetical protein